MHDVKNFSVGAPFGSFEQHDRKKRASQDTQQRREVRRCSLHDKPYCCLLLFLSFQNKTNIKIHCVILSSLNHAMYTSGKHEETAVNKGSNTNNIFHLSPSAKQNLIAFYEAVTEKRHPDDQHSFLSSQSIHATVCPVLPTSTSGEAPRWASLPFQLWQRSPPRGSVHQPPLESGVNTDFCVTSASINQEPTNAVDL